jgi:hypothetical protein
MNKLACKILWWQGIGLAALALARQIAWLAGFQPELGMAGLNTAGCLAFAALSMALSRTRLCGLLPGLAALSSSALGLGFLIIGFWVPFASPLVIIDPCASFGLPLVYVVGSVLAFLGLATMTGGVVDCKQAAGMKMDKPLRIGSLLLALYVQARVLIGAATLTWFSNAAGAGEIPRGFFETVLLFLSAAGVILSLFPRWPKASTALSSGFAAAFIVGAILFAGGLSASYLRAISGNAFFRIALGVALLFPSFLRRFSAKR